MGALLRFAFLIELTNLTVGSTKMKTRWMPGLILMPQPGSFEPFQGTFQPGNDPRSSDFNTCVDVFTRLAREVCLFARTPGDVKTQQIDTLREHCRVPYEFPISYVDGSLNPLHVPTNVQLAFTDHLTWVLKARQTVSLLPREVRSGFDGIADRKLNVKVYKTDRALTGKDKTNRAKRWEVLYGDFQYATLQQCWSVERKLTADLVCFQGAPAELRKAFVDAGLLTGAEPPTRCPVTLDILDYGLLVDAILNPNHGRSDYQIGHLNPLKTGGRHEHGNVCWQSADGNRIQGDLTIAETNALMDRIFANRVALTPAPLLQGAHDGPTPEPSPEPPQPL